ncbi:MAG: hypothetical protein COB98_01615 [Flavobacteriaceae bacterium]|nr:MAG: hypothetical protein COB98_01615 [Flavobacteriaceae bacterium]
MEKEAFNKLINKAKKSIKPRSFQQVSLVKKKITTEIQFSFYIEKSVLKKLKIKAIEQSVSLKHLINTAILKELGT